MSFASDSSLDFQRERETIDAAIPTSAKLWFLANPSQEVLTSTLKRLKPNVLHIATHGSYDFIEGRHFVGVGHGQFLPLQLLMELLSDHTAEVLVLGICESARLSSDVGFQMPEAKTPSNIVGYSYPCWPNHYMTQSRHLRLQETSAARAASRMRQAVAEWLKSHRIGQCRQRS